MFIPISLGFTMHSFDSLCFMLLALSTAVVGCAVVGCGGASHSSTVKEHESMNAIISFQRGRISIAIVEDVFLVAQAAQTDRSPAPYANGVERSAPGDPRGAESRGRVTMELVTPPAHRPKFLSPSTVWNNFREKKLRQKTGSKCNPSISKGK